MAECRVLNPSTVIGAKVSESTWASAKCLWAKEARCDNIDDGSSSNFTAVWVTWLILALICAVLIAVPWWKYVLRGPTKEDESKDALTSVDGQKPRRAINQPLKDKKKMAKLWSDEDDGTPNLEKAKANFINTSPVLKDGEGKARWRSVTKTSLHDLSEIGGSGVELYFKLTLGLGCVFAFMSLLSIPTMIFASYGNFAPESGSAIGSTLVGNLGNVATKSLPQQNRYVIVGCQGKQLSEMTKYFGWTDFIGIVIFAVFALYFRFIAIPREQAQDDREMVTPGDYSILVDFLPPTLEKPEDHANYRELLKEHFTKLVKKGRQRDNRDIYPGGERGEDSGIVNEVSLVRDRDGKLDYMLKRGECLKQQKIARFKGDDKTVDALQKKIEALEKKLATTEKAGVVGQDTERNLPVVRAYVILNTTQDVDNILHDYRFSGWWALRAFQGMCDDSLRFQGAALLVEKAPEPSNIIWENQDYSFWSRKRRQFAVCLVWFALMGASLGFIYGVSKGAKTYGDPENGATFSGGQCGGAGDADKQKKPDHVECNRADAIGWKLEKQVNINKWVLFGPNGAILERQYDWNANQEKKALDCYCRTQGLGKIGRDDKLYDACKQTISDQASRAIVTGVGALITCTVNVVMSNLLLIISEWERPLSVSDLHSSQMIKVAVAQTLNSALIIFWVNFHGFGFKGLFDDFERGWYTVVGTSIAITMSLNTVINAVCYFIFWGLAALKRRCSGPKHQAELEELWTNPPFDLASRYAYLLMTVYVTLIYSAGIPILNLFAMAYMFIQYWCDKLVLLRGSMQPPYYDSKMPKEAAGYLINAVTLHCFVAIGMYGHPCTFPSNPLGGTLEKFSDSTSKKAFGASTSASGVEVKGTANTFRDRMARDSTWMFAALFWSSIAFYCFWIFCKIIGSSIGKCCVFCCMAAKERKEQAADAADHQTYKQAFPCVENEWPPLSYLMERNPTFQKVSKELREEVPQAWESPEPEAVTVNGAIIVDSP